MARAQQAVAAPRLKELPGRLAALPGFAEVLAGLAAGRAATLDGVWGSSRALVAAALAEHAPQTLVVVCPHAAEMDSLCDDLPLFSAVRPATFPAQEAFADDAPGDEEFGQRMRVLKRLAGGSAPRVVVTNIHGLMQPVAAAELLSRQTRRLKIGEETDLDELLAWLAGRGFNSTSAVQFPGEFSRRGGIVDVFVPEWLHPVRVEFDDDEVESIRQFDVASQRSLQKLDEIDLTVVDAHAAEDAKEHFAAHLPPESWFLLFEPAELEEEGRRYFNRQEKPELVHPIADVLAETTRFANVTAERIAAGSLESFCHLPIESIERFSGDVSRVRQEVDAAAAGQEVLIVCQTGAEAQRLEEIFAGSRLAGEGKLHFPVGNLEAGFRLVTEGVVLISGAELFHRTDLSRRSSRRLGRVIDSFLELREGELVVHVAHGVARYLGVATLEKAGQVEEHLELEFHGGTKVFVPASKVDLVQKYVGGSKRPPKLARIGGKAWTRQKHKAEMAVQDLAADLLELQAARAARPGIAFAAETEWQREFEASFPYAETNDQLSAIAAIKEDMQRPQPADRLICGDVGYGKTELAMRAAFKAVDNGYQVAVLVPTTVLAEQHFRTFRERMAEYPFLIERLSRFATKKQQREIIERCSAGGVDIVIGTHRLAQADVRFSNLGLVIIDEEQRFGVEVKERLKKLRHTVDVLTLTATPIPRTLHMSLLGLRDISNLETAPADRLAVATKVTRFERDLIRHAILRELDRDGQIFFVHNRIEDIEAVARKLRQIVPEASMVIGHGQMPEGELERVMMGFVNGRFDILLSTTIIESGLDIPNANTIFIDEADRYGLADLHQLRGRVGRYKHRAYCYLLVDPNKSLNPVAARRLRAIEEFSDMGAGFAIAMRDLEIRGAGNILGSEQSGHINAVGYELYCSLLENAVRHMQALPPRQQIDVNIHLPIEALLPRQYVPDIRLKIDLYRRLARVSEESGLAEIRDELEDRFGPIPEVAARLLELMRLRIAANGWGVHTIHQEGEYVVLEYSSQPKIRELAAAAGRKLRVVDDRSAYLPLDHTDGDANQLLQRLQQLFTSNSRQRR